MNEELAGVAAADARLDGGAVVSARVVDELVLDSNDDDGATLASKSAAGWLDRARAGFAKAQATHEREPGAKISITRAADSAGSGAGKDRFAKLTEVVPGLASFRGTGRAAPSVVGVMVDDGLLVEEEVLQIRKPKPRPLPDLIHATTEDAAGLVHSEIALAKSEIKQRAKIIGPSIALFLLAGFIVLYAISVLIWAVVLGLGHAVPLWLSALIVGLAMMLVALALVLWGVRMLKKLGQLKFLAGGTFKDDITAITNAFKTKNWANEQDALKEGRL